MGPEGGGPLGLARLCMDSPPRTIGGGSGHCNRKLMRQAPRICYPPTESKLAMATEVAMRRIAIVILLGVPGMVDVRADEDSTADANNPKLVEARALLAQANAHRDARRFDEAVAAYEKALALLEEGGAGKGEVAGTLNEYGMAHYARGRAADAAACWERALALLRGVHKGDHPDVAISLNNLASILDALDHSAEALPLHQEALAMCRRLFQGDHPAVAKCLTSLAQSLDAAGRSAEALPLKEEALAIYRRLVKGDHPVVASCLNHLAFTLGGLGRPAEALPLLKEALAMRRRLFKGDHPEVAQGFNNLAHTLDVMGRPADALPLHEEALAMYRRLFKGDHPDVAIGLNNLAPTLGALGRAAEALPLQEEALAMRRRLFKGDHPHVAMSLNNLASSLCELGRPAEALPLLEEALAMCRRLFKGDHPDVARGIDNLASTLDALGRPAEALPLNEEALAMYSRLFKGDHPDLATCLSILASTLGALGRHDEALPLQEKALAMRRRLFEGDHPDVAMSLNNLASTLVALGRPADALPLQEEALAMRRRLFEGDHPDVAKSLNYVASTFVALGCSADALPVQEEALAMRCRLFEGDHLDVATSLNNLASTLASLGRPADALPRFEEALAMSRRLVQGDHPDVATSLHNLAFALTAFDRPAEALPRCEEALAMQRRLFTGDHPDVAQGLGNLASTLDALGRRAEALPLWREAAEMGVAVGWPWIHWPLVELARVTIDGGDAGAALSPLNEAIEHLELRGLQAVSPGVEGSSPYAERLRRADPFPPMVEALLSLGRTEEALAVLERGRAPAMLALLVQGRADPLATALARAKDDAQATARLDAVQRAVADAEAVVVLRTQEAERVRAGGRREEIRAAIDAESEARRSLEEAGRHWLHALREMLPETRPLAAPEIQALLAPGERMLVYGLGDYASFVFVVRPKGEAVEAVKLDSRIAVLSGAVGAYAEALAKPGSFDAAAGRRLFDMVLPARVWREVKSAKRLYLLPHGPLHRIPFEALPIGDRFWVDEGPPIAYAPTASVLAWLRSRNLGVGEGFVAVGDPRFEEASIPWPEKGVLIREVIAGGQAAELGLRPGDVVAGFGDRESPDMDALRAALASAPADAETMPLLFVREGEEHTVLTRPGSLGVFLAEEPPTVSGPALLAQGQIATVLRSDASRRGLLPALPGTRREVEAIREAFAGVGAKTVALLGAEATEERLFEAAKGARYLHLATHGLIDETGSASFSALALTRPRVPVPGDDGFLTLADLLERWRGRLDGTRLVVLSACETQKGRLLRDEGMLALPLGFCFAGARAAVASLWRVDDKSTALLMEDLYRRMLAEGAPGPCEALHEARKALRKTHPEPYYWGAFVYVGAP